LTLTTDPFLVDGRDKPGHDGPGQQRSAAPFGTHEFPVDQVDKATAQAFDIDAFMKVILRPNGG
jgi:hypothetical protein